jgi:hypothetical protein
VVAKWEAADLPAEGTHACWLSAVFTNGDPIASGAHVWEANNLAQKNLTIVEMAAGEGAEMVFVVGNRAIRAARRVVLELWQSKEGPRLAATLASASAPALGRAVRRSGRMMPEPRPAKAEPSVGLHFLEPARVELTGLLEPDGETAILELAPGSQMTFPPAERGPEVPRRAETRGATPLTARLQEDVKGIETIAFADSAASGVALGLREGEFLRTVLRLRAPRDAKPGARTLVDLVQRDANGVIVGGISIAVVIAEPKTSKQTTKTGARSAHAAKQRRGK